MKNGISLDVDNHDLINRYRGAYIAANNEVPLISPYTGNGIFYIKGIKKTKREIIASTLALELWNAQNQ